MIFNSKKTWRSTERIFQDENTCMQRSWHRNKLGMCVARTQWMRGEWKETRLMSLTGASNVGHYGSQEGFQVGSFAVLSRKVMSCELIYAFEKLYLESMQKMTLREARVQIERSKYITLCFQSSAIFHWTKVEIHTCLKSFYWRYLFYNAISVSGILQSELPIHISLLS